MSKTTVVIVEGACVSEVECAVVIVIGRPDDFFDQIKAYNYYNKENKL